MTRDNRYDVSFEMVAQSNAHGGMIVVGITHGVSVPRNKLLFNHGINLLPYTGAGSGITKAMKFTPEIKFANDEVLK